MTGPPTGGLVARVLRGVDSDSSQPHRPPLKPLYFWPAETHSFSRRISFAIKVEKSPMKPIKSNPNEEKCPACGGTGFPAVQQPKPGRRIYPPPCKTCGGKGRLMEAVE